MCLLTDTTPVTLPSPLLTTDLSLLGHWPWFLSFYNLKQNDSLVHFTSYCPISLFSCKNKHTKTDFKKWSVIAVPIHFPPFLLSLFCCLVLLLASESCSWESHRWPLQCMLWWPKLSLRHTSFQGWQLSTLDTFPTWLLGYQTLLLFLPHWSHILRWAINCTIPRDAT